MKYLRITMYPYHSVGMPKMQEYNIQVKKMKHEILTILFFVVLFSCKENREIKFSGFDDTFFGSESINLFENNEFNIELGIGFHKGKYKINNDTIFLFYANGNGQMPNKFLLNSDNFESLEFERKITINRTDTNRIFKKSKKNIFNPQEKFEIKKINKSVNYPSSEEDNTICKNWQLSKIETEKLLKEMKQIEGSDWHYLFEHLPCEITGNLFQESFKYKYSVNSGGWASISTSDTTIYLGNFRTENNRYFLSSVRKEEIEE